MKKYLYVGITILFCSLVIVAQTSSPTFTPTPKPTPSPRPDQLSEKDTEAVSGFTVTAKSAAISCDSQKTIKFTVVFDQTFDEIERVSTVFGQTALLQRFIDFNAYHLMNLANGNKLTLSNPEAPLESKGLNYITFVVTEPEGGINSGKYSLFLRGLKLAKGASEENPAMLNVGISSSCADIPKKLGTVAPLETKSPPALYEYAKKNFQINKSSPEVKVAFAMTGERPTKPFYATIINAEPFEIKRLGLSGAYSVVPIFLNLEKNDTPGSEVDKLKFGSKLRHLFVFEDDGKYSTDTMKTSPFMGIRSEITGQFETTTKFKTGNIVLGLKTGLPINLFQTRSQSMRVIPFVGFDIGYRLLNADSTSKERLIARPSVGTEFYYTPFRTESDIPVSFEASYILRGFLSPEEIKTRDANRKVILEGESTNPKHYFSFTATFWQSRFISPFVKYTYGRDTTQYLLEDHKYIFGIQANFDWGKKP